MIRLTYRDEDNRARLTLQGKRIYCSTQATADTLAEYEELLEKLGYTFDNQAKEALRKQANDEVIFSVIELPSMKL